MLMRRSANITEQTEFLEKAFPSLPNATFDVGIVSSDTRTGQRSKVEVGDRRYRNMNKESCEQMSRIVDPRLRAAHPQRGQWLSTSHSSLPTHLTDLIRGQFLALFGAEIFLCIGNS